MQFIVTLYLPSMLCANSLNFVLECCNAAYANRAAFYGRTACTNVGRFSRSWGGKALTKGELIARFSVVFPSFQQ